MTQFGQPESDITMDFTLSSGSNGWELVDGETAEDTGIITGNASAEVAECRVTSLTDPEVGTAHTIRVRHQSVGGGGAPERLDFELIENTTQRALINNQAANRGSFVTTSYTLSAAEADAISDYTNLRLRVTIGALAGGEAIDISWMVLEIPDFVAGGSLPPLMRPLRMWRGIN